MARSRRQVLFDSGIICLFACITVPRWGTWLEDRINLRLTQKMPSWAHPLGTDHLGRDLLVRLARAIADAALPLWLTVLTGVSIGTLLALMLVAKAHTKFGKILRHGVNLVASIVGAIPLTLITFALAVVLEEADLKAVLLALGVSVILQSYLQLANHIEESRRLGYWTAHEALGGTLLGRIWRYGIRSAWTQELALSLGYKLRAAVIVEATLSYLGFGIQEPEASFGNILAAHFAASLHGKWWVMAATLSVLMVTAAAPQSLIRLASTRQKPAPTSQR
ncbi:MAG: hypothetical protein FJ146_15440 [Deltaproteobacteria bacterium]|nr:hypothetical protein [Deltaproteobacteria bacterium]